MVATTIATIMVAMLAVPGMVVVAIEVLVVTGVSHSSSSRSRRTMVATRVQYPERETVHVSIVVKWDIG